MSSSVTRWAIQTAVLAALALPALTACEVRGIGDPCTPEAIPSGGFDMREVYVETSSVQCRTRTCMVFRLAGNPACVTSSDPTRHTCSDPECAGAACVDGDTDDVTAMNSLQRVFCSCRCSASDANTPLCACSSGYHCVEVLTAGGVGIQGGYCVPIDYCTSDDDCDGSAGSCGADGICLRTREG